MNNHTFASDNYAGVHPEILEALTRANVGHARAYGADPWTAQLQEVVRGHFGDQAAVYPVFNGTGANVVALMSMLPRWGAVVTSRHAHINNDENAAPERVGGIKLLTVDAPDGKLTPASIDQEAWGWGDQHRAQPLVVSLTQSTELGTVYTPDEILALTEHAHSLDMRVHMDGARIANAAARLGVGLRALTTDVGIDVLSFGGTKNGLMYGEAVVVLDPAAVEGVDYVRKMTMQLASKMRFASAQLVALLDGDLWLRSATHANAMATRLRTRLDELVAAGDAPGLSFTQDTHVNAVFAALPVDAANRLRQQFAFYDWDAARGEVRWMCSFDTTDEDVDAFVSAIVEELGRVASTATP
ncbi:threonine aldolase family protein [Sanguibacter antarcticus]|uniref:L-threonine aldolase n=1 Tax=Sanguibacter antarcticus TaxID=372484 RepID=A0A2A9E4T6_9MICO|nr:low specificity L-threonine aldolase [Sanguibacter antarcticus]PFG34057.1 L-threonine aldolase [Sanguibacter antarcticus]